MIQLMTPLSLFALFVVAAAAQGAEHPELRHFPPAKEGQQRFVIVLPEKERGEDEAFMVELIVGKTIQTDGVNRYFLGAILQPRTVEGFGYTYYEMTGNGQVGSTLIGVPEGTPPVEKFVAGNPLKIAYNSRLPIVVFVPEGIEVRWRLWTASDKTETAERG